MALWKEQNLPTRDEGSQENNAVILGWDYGNTTNSSDKARYEILLSEADSIPFNDTTSLQFTLGAGNHEWLDFNLTDEQKEALRRLYERFRFSLHPPVSLIHSESPRLRSLVEPLVKLGFEPSKV